MQLVKECHAQRLGVNLWLKKEGVSRKAAPYFLPFILLSPRPLQNVFGAWTVPGLAGEGSKVNTWVAVSDLHVQPNRREPLIRSPYLTPLLGLRFQPGSGLLYRVHELEVLASSLALDAR